MHLKKNKEIHAEPELMILLGNVGNGEEGGRGEGGRGGGGGGEGEGLEITIIDH